MCVVTILTIQAGLCKVREVFLCCNYNLLEGKLSSLLNVSVCVCVDFGLKRFCTPNSEFVVENKKSVCVL